MRSKAPLLLMEQMVMLLVFALAAAICLQAFVKSDGLSGASEDRDRAVTLCQTAAETVRWYGGDIVSKEAAEELGYHYDKGVMYQEFDENWDPVDYGVYRLEASGIPADAPGDRIPGLRKAHVCVAEGYNAGQELEILFEIEVAWQAPEVTAEVLAEVEIDDGTAD